MRRRQDEWERSIHAQLMREYDRQLAEARARYRKALAEHLPKATQIAIFRLDPEVSKGREPAKNPNDPFAGAATEATEVPDGYFPLPGLEQCLRMIESRTITDAATVARFAGELAKAAVKKQNGTTSLGHLPDYGVHVLVHDECILTTTLCLEGEWMIGYPDYHNSTETLDMTKELKAICRELLPVPEK